MNEKEKEMIKKLGYDLFDLGFDVGFSLDKPTSYKKPEDYNETKTAIFDSYWNSLETHWLGLIKGSSLECEEKIIENREV